MGAISFFWDRTFKMDGPDLANQCKIAKRTKKRKEKGGVEERIVFRVTVGGDDGG